MPWLARHLESPRALNSLHARAARQCPTPALVLQPTRRHLAQIRALRSLSCLGSASGAPRACPPCPWTGPWLNSPPWTSVWPEGRLGLRTPPVSGSRISRMLPIARGSVGAWGSLWCAAAVLFGVTWRCGGMVVVITLLTSIRNQYVQNTNISSTVQTYLKYISKIFETDLTHISKIG